MDSFYHKIQSIFIRWKTAGILHVVYALLTEALIIGYLGFAGLFTIETLLPTFVTVRFSLTKFLFILLMLSFVLTALANALDISFERKVYTKNPLFWCGLLWTLFILILSLYKFPPLFIPLIILAFFLIGFLFWKILFDGDK